MNTYWKINTHGDPLGALQKFVKALWTQTDLDVLVIAPGSGGYVLESPDQLEHLNPFSPVMKVNTAQLAVKAARERVGGRLGVLLRPCEMRALNEMAARGAVERDRLLTICVDCLGTFPANEFDWRAARAGSPEGLTDETLHFASQGGISAYRYRPACQMCAEPGATEADVNIGVFGLPVRQSMLVSAHDGALVLQAITDGPADEELVTKHDQMLAKIAERHNHTRARVLQSLENTLPTDLDSLIEQFETCGECQSCMDVCPICSVEHPRRRGGKLVREDVVHWLLSCAGCGMCEQACPKHQPLNAVFSRIREQIEAELA
jgi:formate dehydrogenase subunit beta